jgi:hypothetical protein
LVLRILRDPWTHEGKVPNDGWLPEAVKQKYLTAPELLHQRDAFAAAWTGPGPGAQLLAEFAAREDRWADAAQFYDVAATANQAASPMLYARLRLSEIACLIRSGQIDKAAPASAKLKTEYPALPPYRGRVAALEQIRENEGKKK